MEDCRVHRRTQVQRHIEVRPLEECPADTSEWMRSDPSAESRLTPSFTAIPGHLIDIGCGGMCAEFAQRLEIGQAFEILIHDSEGTVQTVHGTVSSTRARGAETFHGFSFDEPLLALGGTARRSPKIIDDHAVKPLVLVDKPAPYADAIAMRVPVSDALDRLEDPFFLYLHYVDPHDPYTPHLDRDFSPEYEGPMDGSRDALAL